jgi:tRNA nucleotidyltransferase (CCA-adding enzyme)
MNLPAPLRAALESVRRAGGRPRVVGGSVRDWLLGLEPKDFDVEVFGLDFEAMGRALAPFGPTDLVGRSFGVLKVRIDGTEYDFSLPRRESKTGAGHRGFAVAPDAALTEAEAAARRDFTVNAIAWDPFSDSVIDPHDGQGDLRRKLLRHTSAAFSEDPLRVLRALQLAARFDFDLAAETARLAYGIRDAFRELPTERVWGEWDKWATKSTRPSRGLDVLKQTGWLVHFPEIAALDGLPQEPEWHPEGDVFVHTRLCLDALARLDSWNRAEPATRRVLSFAVLAHDFGKATTTVRAERRGALRWVSPGHESAGGPLAEAFLRRLGAPGAVLEVVPPLVVNHLAHHHGQQDFHDNAVRRLARRLAPATIDQLVTVMLADHFGRPPLESAETMQRIRQLQEASQRLALRDAAPKPLLQGRHLQAAGLTPGPAFKPILDAAFEAQLDGAFLDEAGARVWLENYLRRPPPAIA